MDDETLTVELDQTIVLEGRRGEGTRHYTIEGRAQALPVVLQRLGVGSQPMRFDVVLTLAVQVWPPAD